MIVTQENVLALLKEASAGIDNATRHCSNVDSWIRPDLATGFEIPRHASWEHRRLAELSRTPWLGLVITSCSQAMRVDGWRGTDGDSEAALRLWNSSDLQGLQGSMYTASLAYGESFAVAAPAEGGVRIRFRSPRQIYTSFEDVTDPYPDWAAELIRSKKGTETWRVMTSTQVIHVIRKTDMITEFSEVPHRAGVTPVVRYAPGADLEGRSDGDVLPLIPTAARINKTSYDRLLSQHFNSWKVRYATGLDLVDDPEDPDAAERAAQEKIRLSQEDFLASPDPETKFGTLDSTDIRPFVDAWRSDVEALAAVSQTPAYALTGQLVNLSADALAASRAPLTQKIMTRRDAIEMGHIRIMRAAAALAGITELVEDLLLRPHWADHEIRSMSQAVDALGKAASMLGIPREALWSRIPGVEAIEIAEWRRLVREESSRDPLSFLNRHAEPQNLEEAS